MASTDVALETIIVGGTPATEIVVAGSVASPYSDLVLARFKLDGSFDTSFGSGGSVVVGSQAINFTAGRLAIQSDGKILEAGASTNSRGETSGHRPIRY